MGHLNRSGFEVREIHTRLRQVRQQGAGVLLISEDLDELLALADRIVVMSEGRIVFETAAKGADRHVLGAHMGGNEAPPEAPSAPPPRGRHQQPGKAGSAVARDGR